MSSANSAAYAYYPDGSLKNVTLPNNVSTAYTYDSADRLASVVNSQPGPTPMSSYIYTLDNLGNTAVVMASNGNVVSQTNYYPFSAKSGRRP